MDFVVSRDISLFFVTETWLTDATNNTTAAIKSFGFKIYHCFRDFSQGGGVAIIYRPMLKVIRVKIDHNRSFESVSAKIKLHDNTFLMCSCIYRPDGSVSSFLSDFNSFLEDIFMKSTKLLICGDLNIHLDVN